MRSLTLLAGCLLAAPGWASPEQGDIRGVESHSSAPVIRASPADDEGHRDLEPKRAPPDPAVLGAWQSDYLEGQRKAKTGATMGWAGLAAMGTGALLFVAGEAIQIQYPKEFRYVLFYGVIGGGLVSTQIGAPIAANGANRSRRALVAGGQVKGPCLTCVVAAVAWVPNPFSLFTLPLSYVLSAQQRRWNQARYQRYTGLHAPRVNAGPDGVRLSWAF